jgi:hypothetical protein
MLQYERHEKYIAEASTPVLEFRAYPAGCHGDFYSLLRVAVLAAKAMWHLKIPSIMGKMPAADWKQWCQSCCSGSLFRR